MSNNKYKQLVAQTREQLAVADDAAPTDLRWARAVLDGKQQTAQIPPRPEVLDALIEESVELAQAEVLTWLAQQTDKEISKAARKGLHQLRARKVKADAPPPAVESRGTGENFQLIYDGLLSAYDALGQRLVWVTAPASRGLLLYQARVSARHGLLAFDAGRMNRRAYRQLQRDASDRLVTAVVDAETAKWYIGDAARRCTAIGRSLPAAYARFQHELGIAAGKAGDHPALRIDTRNDQLTDVFRLQELRAWLPEEMEFRALARQLEEIATSQIIADDAQRAEQRNHAVAKWTAEYFNAERAEAARRQALDTAHLLMLRDQRFDAERLRAVADVFAQPAETLPDHPFVRHFVERLIAPANRERDPEQGETERPASNLIVR
ncbi:MAG: hypothetical protein H6707_16140 [Deltaproteobacteria bacterium]|nr:hypothetical protein [Deltaproteobacteria bacterium]